MRVLFVQGAGARGGAERVLLWLATGLRSQGVEPTVLFLSDGPFLAEVEAAGIQTTQLLVTANARQVWRTPKIRRLIRQEIRRSGADVVQANGEKMALYTGGAAKAEKVPAVFWLHDAPFRSVSSALLQLVMARTHYDAAVAGSKWMSRDFRRLLRMKVQTIRHGVDLTSLQVPPADLGEWFEFRPGALTVGHFARLQRWKGAETFLRAGAKIAADFPDLRLLVVGGALYGWEQQYADALPQLAAELGIADRTRFTGHREDSLAIMKACDVVVHSSLLPEPLGMVIPEAMGMAKAVIASRTKGPEELIEDGSTGLLVPPGDEAALGAAMARLARDPDARESMGAAAQKAILAEWSSTRMASEFSALYARLAQTRV